jgi:uncharacterized NAD(P)/FAD-binding protein YdhS
VAVQLLRRAGDRPLTIHLINKGYPVNRGVAYAPHNPDLLLNVPNGRISALPEFPDHYVNWLNGNLSLTKSLRDSLNCEFSTREQYGAYLNQLWEQTLSNKGHEIEVKMHEDYAVDLDKYHERFLVHLQKGASFISDYVILATGNALPRKPEYFNEDLFTNAQYFIDPWKKDSITGLNPYDSILIIGNGLTMTDTVIGLEAAGFSGPIYTVSPHGYRLLPWHDGRNPYNGTQACLSELQKERSLSGLLKIFNLHRKKANLLNQSPYNIIDGLRPRLAEIWQSFTDSEKQQFVKYLSAYWNSIRHRLPNQVHQQIQKLQHEKRLQCCKGRIVATTASTSGMEVDRYVFVC